MSITEDQLRAALAETAGEIAPGSLSPLRLPEPAAPGRAARPAGRYRPAVPGGRRWLAPLGAAAGVLAIAIGALAIVRARGPEISPPGPARGLPGHFVELSAPGRVSAVVRTAVVRSTATGQVLATIRVPKPANTFIAVSAARDGRSYVLAAVHVEVRAASQDYAPSPVRLYLLKLTQAGREQSLGRLPVPVLARPWSLAGLRMSPDGTKLAVARDNSLVPPGARPPRHYRSQLTVYTVATGAARTWSAEGDIATQGTTPALSWTSDGSRVAFNWNTGAKTAAGLRLLNLSARGGNLIRDSRRLITIARLGTGLLLTRSDSVLTPDGRTAIALSTSGTSARPVVTVERALLRTGRVTRTGNLTLGRGWRPAAVLWTNPAGRVLVLEAERLARASQPQFPQVRFGVLHGDRLSWLAIPAGSSPVGLDIDPADSVAW